MKKVLSVILAICMILSASAAGFAVFAEEDKGTVISGTEVYWKIVSDETGKVLTFVGTGAIPDYNNTDSSGDFSAAYPWKNLDYTSVCIGEGISAIGNGAFAGSSDLTEAVIPETVELMGSEVFQNCAALKSAEINAKTDSVSPWTFAGCAALETVKLPESAKTIGLRAFYNCNALKTVEIPAGVKSVGEYAFSKCVSLESIVLPSATKIGQYAFYSCEKLVSADLGGAEAVDAYAFSNCAALSSVTFSDKIKTVGEKAFNICPALKAVTLGGKITSIGNMAFGFDKRGAKVDGFTITGYEDTAAQKYANDNGFKFVSLGHYTYGDCGENAKWSFDEATGTLTVSGTGAIADYTAESLPEYSRFAKDIKKISIGDGITEIGAYAFYNMTPSGTVIPETVTKLGEKSVGNYVDGVIADGFKLAGYYCSAAQAYAEENEIGFENLTPMSGEFGDTAVWTFDEETGTLTISGTGATGDFTVESLPSFNENFNITEVVVEDGITRIGDYALDFGKAYTTISIAQSVAEIGEKPFGFKAVKIIGEDETESVEMQAFEALTVNGYDETPVKEYAETNGFDYVSLSTPVEPPVEPEFPEFTIDELFLSKLDKENKLIWLYEKEVGKDAFLEKFPCDLFTSVIVSKDVIGTDTTLDLETNEEKQSYAFIVSGDANGDGKINSADALAMLQHSVGAKTLEGNALKAADILANGTVNSADALSVLQISVGQKELKDFYTAE